MIKLIINVVLVQRNFRANSITCRHVWHTKMCTLIRHTICESLEKKQYLRHQLCWKILKKTQQNQGLFHKFQSRLDLAYQYIKMWILIRDSFCKSLMKKFVTKRKCHLFLWYFFRHRAMFTTCPNKESRKSKIRSR